MKKNSALKKIIIVLVGLLILAMLFNCGGNSEDAQSTDAEQNSATENVGSDSQAEKTAFDDIDVQFNDEFRNDVTGNWRMASVATDHRIEDYVIDYANEFFKSDDEIHFVYNFTLKTENVVRKNGNELTVTVNDYVEDEEHDAKLAGTGQQLDYFIINMDTGEITRL